jgi:hypothetical protein
MYKKVILIVVGLLVVAVIAFAQGGFEAPGGGGPMGPPPGGQMGPGMPGMPGMGQMMPGMMMPGMGGSPVMVANGNNLYILRGDQVIKLDDDLKVVKQITLPRPQMPRPPNMQR